MRIIALRLLLLAVVSSAAKTCEEWCSSGCCSLNGNVLEECGTCSADVACNPKAKGYFLAQDEAGKAAKAKDCEGERMGGGSSGPDTPHDGAPSGEDDDYFDTLIDDLSNDEAGDTEQEKNADVSKESAEDDAEMDAVLDDLLNEVDGEVGEEPRQEAPIDGDEPCRDNPIPPNDSGVKTCADAKKQGLCKLKQTAKQFCAKTCGLCGADLTAEDKFAEEEDNQESEAEDDIESEMDDILSELEAEVDSEKSAESSGTKKEKNSQPTTPPATNTGGSGGSTCESWCDSGCCPLNGDVTLECSGCGDDVECAPGKKGYFSPQTAQGKEDKKKDCGYLSVAGEKDVPGENKLGGGTSSDEVDDSDLEDLMNDMLSDEL